MHITAALGPDWANHSLKLCKFFIELPSILNQPNHIFWDEVVRDPMLAPLLVAVLASILPGIE